MGDGLARPLRSLDDPPPPPGNRPDPGITIKAISFDTQPTLQPELCELILVSVTVHL